MFSVEEEHNPTSQPLYGREKRQINRPVYNLGDTMVPQTCVSNRSGEKWSLLKTEDSNNRIYGQIE